MSQFLTHSKFSEQNTKNQTDNMFKSGHKIRLPQKVQILYQNDQTSLTYQHPHKIAKAPD